MCHVAHLQRLLGAIRLRFVERALNIDGDRATGCSGEMPQALS